MSTFNDIESTKNVDYSECILKSREQSDYAKKKISEDIGHSLVLEMNERWYGTCNFKPEKEMGPANQSND